MPVSVAEGVAHRRQSPLDHVTPVRKTGDDQEAELMAAARAAGAAAYVTKGSSAEVIGRAVRMALGTAER